MQTVSESVYGGPTFDMTVYTVQQLHDEVGRASEENTIMLLEQVFNFAHLNYEIHFDFPVQGGYSSYEGGCDAPFDEWNQDVRDENIPHIAEDGNLLLLNGSGGGCANGPNVNPNRCMAGATPMADFNSYQIAGCGQPFNSAHSILHEVGHNMGYAHADHGGFGHNGDDGNWWRTPNVGGNDQDNACGERIENRVHGPSCKYMFYHWCMVSRGDYPNEPAAPGPPRREYPPSFPGQSVPYRDKIPRPPAECTSGDDCPEGEVCDDGTCVSGGACVGVDCPAGTVCEGGLCVECLDHQDCSGDNICAGGVCQPPAENGNGDGDDGIGGREVAIGGAIGGLFLWFTRNRDGGGD